MKTHVIVKFHEIALKGRNRPVFIRKLMDNLERATQGTGVERVAPGPMMVRLSLSQDADWPLVRERVKKCFGVAKFFRAYRLPPDLEMVKQVIPSLLDGFAFQSFKISAHRSYKQFPLKSMDINRELGAYVQQLTGARVDLTHPELEIFVDVLPREVMLYFEEVKGYGGLPVSMSGRVMVLLSGGIDSPVAAWQMMKRGCQALFVHFHSHPLVDTSSIEKAVELVQLLTQYQYHSILYLVPFAEIQKRIILSVPAPYRVVLYRRFMMRIAEALARRQSALALVTGESVGQVSSQTLENLAAIDEAATMPVLRPLIGFNKQESVDVARDIGTYPVSILPDQDCCTLFTPRNPVTHTELETVRRLEQLLPVGEMVGETLQRVEEREFFFP